MNNLAVGLELVSCHAGRTFLGGVFVGAILALCYAGWVFARWGLFRDDDAPPAVPTPTRNTGAISDAAPDAPKTIAAERDPIESYATVGVTPPAPVLKTTTLFAIGNPITNRIISPEIRQ